MSLSAVRYLTDFADQSVILPLIVCIAAILWLSGWRRGALVWCIGTCATLALMLVLKIGFRAFGTAVFGVDSLVSPSGHTAAAGAVCGSILAFINARLGGREASRLLIVLTVVVLIGSSRILLSFIRPQRRCSAVLPASSRPMPSCTSRANPSQGDRSPSRYCR